jgi:hypothetical protein
MTAPGVPAIQTMNEDPVPARRFRNATPPHLDAAAYTLARYLLRGPADAQDAVQECYLRAGNRAALPRLQRVRRCLMARNTDGRMGCGA